MASAAQPAVGRGTSSDHGITMCCSEGGRQTETGIVSGADGLATDAEGRLYVASAAGVQVFTPAGEHLGTIPVSRAPQNIAFAGPDKKTLYIVGRGAAYKVAMLAQRFMGRAK